MDAEFRPELRRAPIAKVAWRLLPLVVVSLPGRLYRPHQHRVRRADDEPGPGAQPLRLRPGAGIFFIGYALVRGAEQHGAGARGRTPLDRAHHDHLAALSPA